MCGSLVRNGPHRRAAPSQTAPVVPSGGNLPVGHQRYPKIHLTSDTKKQRFYVRISKTSQALKIGEIGEMIGNFQLTFFTYASCKIQVEIDFPPNLFVIFVEIRGEIGNRAPFWWEISVNPRYFKYTHEPLKTYHS